MRDPLSEVVSKPSFVDRLLTAARSETVARSIWSSDMPVFEDDGKVIRPRIDFTVTFDDDALVKLGDMN